MKNTIQAMDSIGLILARNKMTKPIKAVIGKKSKPCMCGYTDNKDETNSKKRIIIIFFLSSFPHNAYSNPIRHTAKFNSCKISYLAKIKLDPEMPIRPTRIKNAKCLLFCRTTINVLDNIKNNTQKNDKNLNVYGVKYLSQKLRMYAGR